nr:hypothetical protein L203_00385 [Cryptococcus depauperatus CBS 7841]
MRLPIPTIFTHHTFLQSLKTRQQQPYASQSRLYLTSRGTLSPRSSLDGSDSHQASSRPSPTLSLPSIHDSNSVLALVKEDYANCKVYMKDFDSKQALKTVLRRHMYKWYIIIIIVIAVTALLSAKHKSVVQSCEPVTRTIRKWPGGWLIPIAVLVVVSFPPLVGHEIVGILCGLVWGLWIGFAILAAGTFLGEIATWIAFKWCCQTRAAKRVFKNKLYASLTQLIREKSFTFLLILRFSAVPGHITTAVSASAGASFTSYLLAAILTLPKQWTIVYLGKAFGTRNRTNTIVSVVCTVITILMTIIAAIYIYYQMRLIMHRQDIALPMTIDTASTSMTISELMDEKHDDTLRARRPWLYANNSSTDVNQAGFRTPMRSWSMPGHMNEEELREWVRGIKEEQIATETLATALNSGGIGGTEGIPVIKVDGICVHDPLPPTFLSPPSKDPHGQISSSTLNTPMINTPSSPSPSLLETSDFNISTSTPRCVASAGTPISSNPFSTCDSPLPSTRQRTGGREIADDADAYARSHGAKRPEQGRMRSDSRTALLGRPVDDAALDYGGSSWKRVYNRARGDSVASSSLGSRPIFDELGRPRDDSAATANGRPTLEDLGVIKGEDGYIRKEYEIFGRSRENSTAALPGTPDIFVGTPSEFSGNWSDSGFIKGDAQESLKEEYDQGKQAKFN